MSNELMSFNNIFVQSFAVNAIIKCNDLTVKYGLVLNEAEAVELTETRRLCLNKNGRVEFGGGIIDKIIIEFCDSPYISMHNYSEILNELIEMFYYYKNETLDLISDDDLLRYMHKSFDGVCQGSLELLYGRELDRIARNLRYGYAIDDPEDDITWEEDEYEEY